MATSPYNLESRLEFLLPLLIAERASLHEENALLKQQLADEHPEDPTLQEAADTAFAARTEAKAAEKALFVQLLRLRGLVDLDAAQQERAAGMVGVIERALGYLPDGRPIQGAPEPPDSQPAT